MFVVYGSLPPSYRSINNLDTTHNMGKPQILESKYIIKKIHILFNFLFTSNFRFANTTVVARKKTSCRPRRKGPHPRVVSNYPDVA